MRTEKVFKLKDFLKLRNLVFYLTRKIFTMTAYISTDRALLSFVWFSTDNFDILTFPQHNVQEFTFCYTKALI